MITVDQLEDITGLARLLEDALPVDLTVAVQFRDKESGEVVGWITFGEDGPVFAPGDGE